MLNKLETLNPAQLAKVFKLIDKLAAKNSKEDDDLTYDDLRKFDHLDANISAGSMPAAAPVKAVGRQPTPTHQIKPTSGPQKHSGTLERRVGRSTGSKKKSNKRGQGKPKKTFTRREPMDLSGNRPNLFDQMYDSSSLHMDDAAIDKKLAVAPLVPRRPPVEYIEVECSVCGDVFDVHPNLVLRTDEGLTFTCNDCTRTSR